MPFALAVWAPRGVCFATGRSLPSSALAAHPGEELLPDSLGLALQP